MIKRATFGLVGLVVLTVGISTLVSIVAQERASSTPKTGTALHIITRDMNGVVVDQQVIVDPDGHLQSEHQIPAGDYCKRPDVTIGPKETHAHHCDCTYACSVDENGVVHEFDGEKQPKCKSYCSKDGRHCTCHVEEPCDLKGRH